MRRIHSVLSIGEKNVKYQVTNKKTATANPIRYFANHRQNCSVQISMLGVQTCTNHELNYKHFEIFVIF